MRVSKLALSLTLLDWLICCVAFVIQWVYYDNDHIFFMSVDLAWALRVILFSLVIMLILNSNENLGRLRKLNQLIVKLFIFQFAVYYSDFVKNWLAYNNDLEFFREAFIIKALIHLIILLAFGKKLSILDKEVSYISN